MQWIYKNRITKEITNIYSAMENGNATDNGLIGIINYLEWNAVKLDLVLTFQAYITCIFTHRIKLENEK